jgi:hypothetical protein
MAAYMGRDVRHLLPENLIVAFHHSSFGIPAKAHAAFTQVQQIGGYDFTGEGMCTDTRQAAAETALPELNERMG